jgi:hypothetical protein
MATQQLIQPFYAGSTMNKERTFRGGPEYPHWKETASQTYGIGDLLYVDTNGTVAIATVNGSNQSNGFIAGQAKSAASGVTGANVHFPIIRSDELFYMNVYHGTAASAVGAQTMLGTIKGVVKISGRWHIDIENTVEGATDALGRVALVEIPKKHPMDGTTNTVTDTYALFIVQFIPYSIASDSVPQARVLQFSF